jgi:hypothetical protein
MARHPVTIEAVLANVQRGRVAYLVLTQELKRALCDRDGQIALDVPKQRCPPRLLCASVRAGAPSKAAPRTPAF